MSEHQEIDTNSNIIVIGDLHADWGTTIALFINLKLCDNNKHWIAGNTKVVQVGDQIDGHGRYGNQDAHGEMEILDFLENLHNEAKILGGGVYSLLGNHEFMNVSNNLSYVSKKDLSIPFRRKLFKSGSAIAKKWANTRNIIMRINDIIFVHGGIVPENTNLQDKNIINYLNFIAREFLKGNKKREDIEVENTLFDHEMAPIWNRELGEDEVECSRVDKTLTNMSTNLGKKINHIIVGHTVQNTINSKCNNKIFRVDVGLSKALGSNTPQVLLIERINGKNYFKKMI